MTYIAKEELKIAWNSHKTKSQYYYYLINRKLARFLPRVITPYLRKCLICAEYNVLITSKNSSIV